MFGRGVWLFLLTAYGWSWATAGVIHAYRLMDSPAAFAVAGLAFMAGPMIGALACILAYDRGRVRDTLGLTLRLNVVLLYAWAVPVVLIGGAFLVDLAFSGARLAPGEAMANVLSEAGADLDTVGLPMTTLFLMQLAAALTIGPAINAVLTLTEELGWRGWLWDRWRPLGFWRGNLAIGLAWGVWHAPLIAMGYNYPGLPVLGPILMVLFTLMMSPLIGWAREAGGSVLHAGLFHGTINALAAVGILAFVGLDWPFGGALGVGGFVAGASLLAGLAALRGAGAGTHAPAPA